MDVLKRKEVHPSLGTCELVMLGVLAIILVFYFREFYSDNRSSTCEKEEDDDTEEDYRPIKVYGFKPLDTLWTPPEYRELDMDKINVLEDDAPNPYRDPYHNYSLHAYSRELRR